MQFEARHQIDGYIMGSRRSVRPYLVHTQSSGLVPPYSMASENVPSSQCQLYTPRKGPSATGCGWPVSVSVGWHKSWCWASVSWAGVSMSLLRIWISVSSNVCGVLAATVDRMVHGMVMAGTLWKQAKANWFWSLWDPLLSTSQPLCSSDHKIYIPSPFEMHFLLKHHRGVTLDHMASPAPMRVPYRKDYDVTYTQF